MAIQNEGNLITSPQTITGAWVTVGNAETDSGEKETLNYSFFSSFIQLDINDSLNVQFEKK